MKFHEDSHLYLKTYISSTSCLREGIFELIIFFLEILALLIPTDQKRKYVLADEHLLVSIVTDTLTQAPGHKSFSSTG